VARVDKPLYASAAASRGPNYDLGLTPRGNGTSRLVPSSAPQDWSNDGASESVSARSKSCRVSVCTLRQDVRYGVSARISTLRGQCQPHQVVPPAERMPWTLGSG
jgi:hypothetical protein